MPTPHHRSAVPRETDRAVGELLERLTRRHHAYPGARTTPLMAARARKYSRRAGWAGSGQPMTDSDAMRLLAAADLAASGAVARAKTGPRRYIGMTPKSGRNRASAR
ncbi:hypothetical protein GCM10009640_20410 [Agrococcus citreus]|uniref:Uncharacterized protein n=1 Tax=Agrococcus citreus TaxID=84643 RepID=A0ABP4JN60_9MICO